jgi:hypothetical protein
MGKTSGLGDFRGQKISWGAIEESAAASLGAAPPCKRAFQSQSLTFRDIVDAQSNNSSPLQIFATMLEKCSHSVQYQG